MMIKLGLLCGLFLLVHAEWSDIAPQLNACLGYDVKVVKFVDSADRQARGLFLATPISVYQIQRLVLCARKFCLTIRAFGAKHSWSPLFADPGNIGLDLSKLTGDKFTIDKRRMLVSSLASATMDEFHEYNKQHGVTIPSAPHIGNPTLQGVTATSSHGAVKEEGPTGSRVYGIDVVDGQGRVRRFNHDDHKHVIEACRVHIGLCGIIFNTTIKVDTNRVFKNSHTRLKVKDVLFNRENRKQLVEENYSVFIFWSSFSGATEEERRLADADELRRPPASWDPKEDYIDVWLTNPVENPSTVTLGDTFDETKILADGTQYILSTNIRMASDTIVFSTVPSRTDIQLRFNVAWATPENDDFTASQATIENYFEVMTRNLRVLGLYADGFGLIRWVTHPNEPCLLCHTKLAKFQMEIEHFASCLPCDTNYLREEVRERLWSTQFALGVMANNSRILPHWGKYYDHIPGLNDLIRKNYGDNLDKFWCVRTSERLDPDNVFMNDNLRKIFWEQLRKDILGVSRCQIKSQPSKSSSSKSRSSKSRYSKSPSSKSRSSKSRSSKSHSSKSPFSKSYSSNFKSGKTKKKGKGHGKGHGKGRR